MEEQKKEYYRKILKKQKETDEKLIESMNHSGLDENIRASLQELSAYDNHPADIGTEVFFEEQALGLKAMHEDSLKKIEDALSKLDNETFGICQQCSSKIDEERLEILPQAKLCIRCAKEKDKEIAGARDAIKYRPDFVQSVTTSFGDKPIDDPLQIHDEGMDILSDLMKYGSAESPSEEGNFKDFNEFYNIKDSEDGIVDEMDRISEEDYLDQIPD